MATENLKFNCKTQK